MATRIGDILSYRAKTKKLQEEASAQEAALDDFPTQASLFIKEVADTATALKPFAKDKTPKAEESDNSAFEYTAYENAISPGLDVGQQSMINRMAKDYLGGTYAEGVDYVMDEDGKFVPKMLAGDAFSMMTYKSKPKTDMGFNIDTSLPPVPEINLEGIKAANKKILEGKSIKIDEAGNAYQWTGAQDTVDEWKERLRQKDLAGSNPHLAGEPGSYQGPLPYIMGGFKWLSTPWYIKEGYTSAEEARAAQARKNRGEE